MMRRISTAVHYMHKRVSFVALPILLYESSTELYTKSPGRQTLYIMVEEGYLPEQNTGRHLKIVLWSPVLGQCPQKPREWLFQDPDF